MIMAGGYGKRFGSDIPKQFTLLRGRPVIDYVIDAVNRSKLTNKALVVIDSRCIDYSELLSSSHFHCTTNGKERYDSIRNGFEYIKAYFPECSKVVILDAVAPFVTPEIIDEYFEILDDYNAVITAQNITGSLGNYSFEPLEREKYYITQSPEGFRFKEIYRCFREDFPSTELAWQLPKSSKFYLNFEFKNNLKLTYDFELRYAEYMLDYQADNK